MAMTCKSAVVLSRTACVELVGELTSQDPTWAGLLTARDVPGEPELVSLETKFISGSRVEALEALLSSRADWADIDFVYLSDDMGFDVWTVRNARRIIDVTGDALDVMSAGDDPKFEQWLCLEEGAESEGLTLDFALPGEIIELS